MHPKDAAPLAKEIGERIRETRKQLGLRQEDVALAAGLSTRTVHQIEHGKPTTRLDKLQSVLWVLGLTLTAVERMPTGQARNG